MRDKTRTLCQVLATAAVQSDQAMNEVEGLEELSPALLVFLRCFCLILECSIQSDPDLLSNPTDYSLDEQILETNSLHLDPWFIRNERYSEELNPSFALR